MAKKKPTRPPDPKVLGDLIPGDRCTIESEWGPIPIRVGWRANEVTFATVETPGARSSSYPADTPIVKLGKLMPNPSRGSRKKQADTDDPLLGKT